jgi:hypothetical protein
MPLILDFAPIPIRGRALIKAAMASISTVLEADQGLLGLRF